MQAELYDMTSYKFNLNTMRTSEAMLQYKIEDNFFISREYSPVKRGIINATIDIQKEEESFNIFIHLDGEVITHCMRCLEEMNVNIKTDNKVQVKLADEKGEDDKFIYISTNEGILDFEPLIYDFIILAIPARTIHAEGECNKEMDEKLRQYVIN